MPTKVRQYGTQVYKTPWVKVMFVRNDNKTIQGDEGYRVGQVARRIGASSILTGQTGRDGAFRPVTHVTERYSIVPTGSLQNYQYSAYKYGNWNSDFKQISVWNVLPGVHALRYTEFKNAVESLDSGFGPVQWNSLAASAVQAMLPSFHTSNSLVNFILELKDFKNVVKYIRSDFGRVIDRMQAYRLKMPDGTYKSFWATIPKDKPLKWLSKRYLEYSFGWRPLFTDVVSLLKEITGFTARYKELVRDAGLPVQKHWSTVVPETATSQVTYYSHPGESPAGSYWGPFPYKARCRVEIEGSPGLQYNATMRLRYAIPEELLAAGGTAKAMLDLLGVSRNPAVLWNAIPFSFLVDWVVNVGKYLDRLRLDNIEFKTEILDFCHSVKSRKRVAYRLATNYITPLGTETWQEYVTTDVCEKVRYERKKGLPDLTLAIQTSGLNVREISLAGALFNARR